MLLPKEHIFNSVFLDFMQLIENKMVNRFLWIKFVFLPLLIVQ